MGRLRESLPPLSIAEIARLTTFSRAWIGKIFAAPGVKAVRSDLDCHRYAAPEALPLLIRRHGGSVCDLSAERARVAKQTADSLERRNRKEAGETFDAATVIEFLESLISLTKARLVSIPTNAALEVAAAAGAPSKATAVESAIRKHVMAALEELADGAAVRALAPKAHAAKGYATARYPLRALARKK
jgi:hypothetical protein